MPCGSASGRLRFERCAEALHGRLPQFVPPLPGSVARHLGPRSVFRQKHGDILPFLAVRNGKPAGRIAAIINRSHEEFNRDGAGFFGFFECIDDAEVAAALFAKVESVLAARGCRTSRGPYNPSINDECGLLVEGFERPPLIGLTWNPSYYEVLVKGCGYERWVSSFGYLLPLHELPPPPRLLPIARRAERVSAPRLRQIDFSHLAADLELVREVYNATLSGNRGFTPVSKEDFEAASGELRAIADPRMIHIAESKGTPAGAALSLPNANELLMATKGTPWLLRALHFLILLKTRKSFREGRQVVYGVSPRFRDRSLHGWLACEHFICAKAIFHAAELGWIQESNHEILKVAELLGGTRYRKWDIYEKPLPAQG